MLLYTDSITPRLEYISAFCGTELFGKPFELTTDVSRVNQSDLPVLNYSKTALQVNAFQIIPSGLLEEKNIREVDPRFTKLANEAVLFPNEGELGYDIFSAAFYLLSRYEEYLPHQKDSYGRYAHENSIAFRQQFLDQPLVNQWILKLADALRRKFHQLTFRKAVFTFQPSYDIDMAWSYQHKGWWRNTGGALRSLITARFSEFSRRLSVLRGKTKDPYDAYGWMNQLHEQTRVRPYYFFLVADKPGRYDKNISPTHPAMQALVSDHLIRYPVGLHPSWRSGDDERVLQKEITRLKQMTGSDVTSSRQHYIRFLLPEGYRRLISNGIRFDFSMGYGSINGFRASVASPFYWYDLEKETATELMLFPFCYMEANSFYEQRYTVEQAAAEMRHYYKVTKEVNGLLITIWHNSFLGTEPSLMAWRDAYAGFIKEVANGA